MQKISTLIEYLYKFDVLIILFIWIIKLDHYKCALIILHFIQLNDKLFFDIYKHVILKTWNFYI
jgi:hypothetical protein